MDIKELYIEWSSFTPRDEDRVTHPHITRSNEYAQTLLDILKGWKKERASLEKKFGKPSSKYHR